MAVKIKFAGWRRSGVFDFATTLDGGRMQGNLTLTLRNRADPTDTVPRTIAFEIMGPPDVRTLQPGAIRQLAPTADAIGVETTKCVHVEFAAPDLPWRYTPQLAANALLRPWIVLVVGTPGEVQLQQGGQVMIAPAALAAHDLNTSARWAHVHGEGSTAFARLLSPRELLADREYVAAIVPAFDGLGQPQWQLSSTAPPTVAGPKTLPCYFSWRFQTGPGGDFRTLAARLKPHAASPELGRAPLEYPRITPAAQLYVRGALAPIGGSDAALPAPVPTDLAQLIAPLTDPRGRPVVTVPAYGAAWTDPAAATWAVTANLDPRHRLTAGLGVNAGVVLQDTLAAAAGEQIGALEIAAQRIRHLTLGLHASGTLWRDRLPTDPAQRLLLYGPSLRRMMSDAGPLLGQIAGGGRPMPPALFSSAARRVLRPGTARARQAIAGARAPGAVLRAANTCPPPPPKVAAGLPHADALAKVSNRQSIDSFLRKALAEKALPHTAIVQLLRSFKRTGFPPSLVGAWDQLVTQMIAAMNQGLGLPHQALLTVLDPPGGKPLDSEGLAGALRTFDSRPDDASLLALGRLIPIQPPRRVCRPVDLTKLEKSVTSAIDPTGANPFVQQRVLASITGLSSQPLAPTEICPVLDFVSWRFLRDNAPDWLLPGGGTLEADSVVGLETNPKFVDGFLIGLNTQALAELRWRNFGVSSKCTPIRRFWGRIDLALDRAVDDIIGVETWAGTSDLGTSAHRPSGGGTDLVIVFKGDLFLRYPHTLIYLTAARIAGGAPDFTQDPAFTTQVFPSFQGKLGDDMVFFGFPLAPADAIKHWVVLEDTPSSYRFRNTTVGLPTPARIAAYDSATDGAGFADAAFEDPTRVLIDGSTLLAKVGP